MPTPRRSPARCTGLVIAERGTVADGEAGRHDPARRGRAAARAPVRGDRGPDPGGDRPHRRGRRRTGPPAPPRAGRLGPALGGRAGRPVTGRGGHRQRRRRGAAGRGARAVPGRLVVWGGANSTWGPVAHYLGLLAATTGETEDAVSALRARPSCSRRRSARCPTWRTASHGLAAVLTARAASATPAGPPRRGRGPASIAERLGLTHLLDRPSILAIPASRTSSEWTLARDGDDWVLTAGGERARLRDGRGLHYLRALLAAPGRDIPALDLAAGGAGLAAAGTGPVLDAAARDAYRRRLDALAAEARRRRPGRGRRGRGQTGGRAAGAGGAS